MSPIAFNSPRRKLGASRELFENKTVVNLKIFVQLLQQKYFWLKQQRGKLPVRFNARIPGLLMAWCSRGRGQHKEELSRSYSSIQDVSHEKD